MDLHISEELKTAVRKAVTGLGPETPRVVLDFPFRSFAIALERTDKDNLFASFTGAEMEHPSVSAVYLILDKEENM